MCVCVFTFTCVSFPLYPSGPTLVLGTSCVCWFSFQPVNAALIPMTHSATCIKAQTISNSRLDQWFPTGGTRTPRGTQAHCRGYVETFNNHLCYVILFENHQHGGTHGMTNRLRGYTRQKRLGNTGLDHKLHISLYMHYVQTYSQNSANKNQHTQGFGTTGLTHWFKCSILIQYSQYSTSI